MAHSVVAGDPSLRLKNGYAQDDAIDSRSRSSSFSYQIVVRESGNRQLLHSFGLITWYF